MLRTSGSHFLLGALLAPVVLAAPSPTPVELAKRATCTVASAAAAASVSSCTTVVISAFTVPSGTTLDFQFAAGTSVTMNGDITFLMTTSAGPLITLEGTGVTLNGNGHTINGNGALYWDGEGTNGGATKPHPFVKVKISGTLENVVVLNSPAQAISLGNTAALTLSGITCRQLCRGCRRFGASTDGFDISTSDVTIMNSVVKNQAACISVNNGSNLVFLNNQCSGGDGIVIGSIASGKSVSNVTISGNTVTTSTIGLAIEVDADATSGGVSDVTYSGNNVSGITRYGVLITQSYSTEFGTPGMDSTISNVYFTGATTSVAVGSAAVGLAIDLGHCTGKWGFSSLEVTGGTGNKIVGTESCAVTGNPY